jgi:hypothetical protein
MYGSYLLEQLSFYSSIHLFLAVTFIFLVIIVLLSPTLIPRSIRRPIARLDDDIKKTSKEQSHNHSNAPPLSSRQTRLEWFYTTHRDDRR